MRRFQRELNSLEKDIEGQANTVAESIIQSFYQQMEAKSNAMEADMDHLEKENAHLRSLLARACRCKRIGGSNGKDEDDDDESGANDPDSDRNAGNSGGSPADDTANPDPHNQQDGTGLSGNVPTRDSSAGDSAPTPQDQDWNADDTAGDLDAQTQIKGSAQHSGNLDADDVPQMPNVNLPPPGQFPRFFVRPAGYDALTRNYQRRYMRRWREEIEAHGDPQRTHRRLYYMIRDAVRASQLSQPQT